MFLSINGGTTIFSNDNDRNFIRTKFGYTIFDTLGISLYGKTYNYENTNPYQIHYFSPKEYGRYLGGIQLRKVLNGFLITSHLDYGIQIVDNETFDSYSYGIGVKKFISNNISIEGRVESNHFQPDYRYTMGLIQISYHF